uniref:Short-chain dehydrogenase/reductase SDR n=1 Tax=Odontella aurita TaxID=265563 RepID=A0A7S4N4A4_9STRA|mmetsp:Transcript_46889/g.142044  ORF Transcript_46889/g.142044 Transcript_46889/m.142044 type:complete len:339 (+) Transcript_46889:260-1276(+)|eukprot:CAMPEP_0113576712 /NCGR_PEP_ID=MMETSP0015_2-20120614/28456_1 /TAXON_ID=2838 /ORGANISM="Odontella" /LENGTH=338 /DNA_ID=CAMNT_0000480193 /DNA_START=183 /DNA_END=1199 /DNA_ORIENTATION=- /assembly_acc=CAM_ASM_000160
MRTCIASCSVASLLLLQCANAAFAGSGRPSSSSCFVKQGRTSQTVVRAGTAESATEAFTPPDARSAVPGIHETEVQPSRNPIGPNSSVLVVGGTRGIGLEFVRQCAQRGASVAATHRDGSIPEALLQLIKACEDDNIGAVSGLQMDVADESSIQNAAMELKSREDFKPLTHIIHSAGTYLKGTTFDGSSRGGRPPAPPVTKDIMMDTLLINAVGPLMVAQSFVPIMGSSPEATDDQLPILAVLTSKVGSIHDNGSGGTYAYRASKSALNNICKSLSVDLMGEISVVLIHPGYVRTDMTGGNGLIDVDESVSGMLRAVESTDRTVGFRFVDYKAELIPW